MDPAEIRAAVDAHGRIHDIAENIFWHIYHYLRPEWRKVIYSSPHITNIEFGEKYVTVKGYSAACGRGCCGTESGSWSFPNEYLTCDYDLDAVTELVKAAQKIEAEQAAKEAREEAEREAREEEAARQAAEAAEHEQYLKLKAKYEGPSP